MAVPLTLCWNYLRKGTQLMDIYSILASKSHNPHYLSKYITFISKCQSKNATYNGLIERHHICPKAKDMFPEYKSMAKCKWNIAHLTPRQHFISHLLLWKAFPEIKSCTRAIWMMSQKRKTNSKLYENLRLEAIKLISEKNSGRKFSQDHREKLSKSHSGKKLSDEHKYNIGKSIRMIPKKERPVKIKKKRIQKCQEYKKGRNSPKHKYVYVTPEGNFYSPIEMESYGIKYKWCTYSDRLVSKNMYTKNSYLNEKYDSDIIKAKTYKELGFYRIEDNYIN